MTDEPIQLSKREWSALLAMCNPGSDACRETTTPGLLRREYAQVEPSRWKFVDLA